MNQGRQRRGGAEIPTCPQVELISFQLALMSPMRVRNCSSPYSKRSPKTSQQMMLEPAQLSRKVGSKGCPKIVWGWEAQH